MFGLDSPCGKERVRIGRVHDRGRPRTGAGTGWRDADRRLNQGRQSDMDFRPNFQMTMRVTLLGAAAAGLAACNDSGRMSNMRAWAPIPAETVSLMAQKGTNKHAPMLIRAYKKEAELEIWKMKSDGKYALLKTYPMCRWSGQLGPKTREGDRQVPEGFYTITPGQMNPNSAYYLSFNVGYPNAYDRAHGRSGGAIMVHGACSSAGCFSMTDQQIAEIYAIARESFGGGQKSIQMQSLPFRMNAENLAKHRLDPNISFWRDLKKGADYFDVAHQEPQVGVCGGRYAFGTGAPEGGCAPSVDPQLRQQVAEKERHDEQRVAQLAGEGVKPIRLMYADGGQHPEFAARTNDVSRPDALASAPSEIELKDPRAPKSKLVAVAAAREQAKEQANEQARRQAKAQDKDATPVGALPALASVAQKHDAGATLKLDSKPAVGKTEVARTEADMTAKSETASAENSKSESAKAESKSALTSVFGRLMGGGAKETGAAVKPIELSPPLTEPRIKPRAGAQKPQV